MPKYRRSGRVKPTWQIHYQKQEGYCAVCGDFTETDVASLEHLIPKGRPYFGPDSMRNTVMACFDCNFDRGQDFTPRILELISARFGWRFVEMWELGFEPDKMPFVAMS